MDDIAWMRRALELARQAGAGGDTPVGSLVVRDGRALAEGVESVRARMDITAHAELIAVREACRVVGSFDLAACTLYTTAEPCWMCSFAIRQARLSRVVMGRPTPVIGGGGPPHALLFEADVPGWGAPPELVRGVLERECAALGRRPSP
jgi:tRNA(adenine34) deaminase